MKTISKYLLIVIFEVLILTFNSEAQVKYSFGVMGTLNKSWLRGTYSYGDKFYVGNSYLSTYPSLIVDATFKNKLTIETGFQYLIKGINENARLFDDSDQFMGTSNYIVREALFSIPLNVCYNFLNKKQKIQLGLIALSDFSLFFSQTFDPSNNIDPPYIETQISDITIMERDFQYEKYYYSFKGTNEENKFNIQIGGGVFIAYEFTRHLHAKLFPFYKVDLTKYYYGNEPRNHYHFHSEGVSLVVFYQF